MRPDGLLKRKEGPFEAFSLSENLWFETLAERGYGVRVYQTDYLDFCQAQPAAVTSCYEMPANSIWFLRDIELPVLEKAQVILYYFVYSLKSGIGIAPSSPSIQLGAIAMPAVVAQISEDLTRNPNGTVGMPSMPICSSSTI